MRFMRKHQIALAIAAVVVLILVAAFALATQARISAVTSAPSANWVHIASAQYTSANNCTYSYNGMDRPGCIELFDENGKSIFVFNVFVDVFADDNNLPFVMDQTNIHWLAEHLTVAGHAPQRSWEPPMHFALK